MREKANWICPSSCEAWTTRAGVVLVACWFAVAVVGATPAQGQTHDDFNRLGGECWELIHAEKYAEAARSAEKLFRWARGPLDNHPGAIAISSHALGVVYRHQGRFTEAEKLLELALDIRREYSVHVDDSLESLGNLYNDQGRYADAERLHKEALELRRKAHGDQHLDVANSLNSLGTTYFEQAQFREAEKLFREALEIRQRNLGDRHPLVSDCLDNLGGVCSKQGRFSEAETLHKQALHIRRKVFGKGSAYVAEELNNLAAMYNERGRHTEAEALLHEARKTAEQAACGPQVVLRIHGNLAWLLWKTDRRQQAVEELEGALDALEDQRILISGGELERASFFVSWMHLYELMLSWRVELKQPSAAFQTMERSRARALLEQMQTAGHDLLADLSEEEAERLRQNEFEAASRVTAMQKQLDLMPMRRDLSDSQKQQEQGRLLMELRQAQFVYTQAYADVRNASPAYRLAVGADLEPVALDRLAQYVERQQSLLLEYLLGIEGGYVLVVAAGGPPRVVALTLDEAKAKCLGVEPGPLTAKRMGEILRREDGTGVLQRLRDPKTASEATDRLAALWEVLVPEAERKAILQDQWKRLVVVPDAALAPLPFETLVVEAGEDPRYLLDAGPPILYAPSATILMNLAEREPASGESTRPAVLTVGDCRYEERAKADDTDVLAQLAPGSRYTSVGGRLAPLPYSAREVQWVADVFGDQGVSVAWLKDDRATEETVRYNVSDRRIVHFACHGLVDQEYGNLFGALALTPGAKADDPKDDGFLTLAEIYELKLKGCELAIPSACDTNYGPHQRGEGVWALSRGFLVAGARRVVASNWLVNDESAPNLMSYFCSILAKAGAAGEKPDYAEALWKAKRWLRSHEQWQSPYYWGSFVLMGPN